MSKKELKNEATAIQKLMQRIFASTTVAYPLKEKTDNFFNNLVKELDDVSDEEEAENQFNNHPRTIKKNLEFLAKKFTLQPTKEELSTIQQYVESLYVGLDKKYENLLSESIKNKEKK